MTRAAVLQPPACIGFIGIGNMGRPMARRLLQAGYNLQIADKNEATVRDFNATHGGTVASSLPTLAKLADVIITMLPDGKVVREVVLGDQGLISHLKTGSIVIDMSSSNPVGTRELGSVLAGRGVDMIDAPVSGVGPGGALKAAAEGRLASMVGGDPAVIARIRPLLEIMATRIFLTGPLGSGHAMKALNNLVSAAGLWIAIEALQVGGQFGLAPETMVDVLNASSGRNNSTENKLKQQILSRAFGSGFSLGLMAKDVRTAQELATAMGAFAPLTRSCADLWDEAACRLGQAVDHTAIARVLEQRAGKGSSS
jgi:3-hydroxyisobutyrate dehydrogenase